MLLTRQVTELTSYIQQFTRAESAVSAGSVGWHISHAAAVINGVISNILNSNPASYRRKFNWKKILVFTLNKIPRGKITAPKSVQPPALITEGLLNQQLAEISTGITQLENLSQTHYFEHPFLGKLTRKETIRFLEIHTQHHLNIIKDILHR